MALGVWVWLQNAQLRIPSLQSFRDSLQLLRLTHVEIETDAKKLVTLLTAAEKPVHHELAAVLSEIDTMLKNDWSVIVRHISKDCNAVAHLLARQALIMALGHMTYMEPPEFAARAYETDLQCANSTA